MQLLEIENTELSEKCQIADKKSSDLANELIQTRQAGAHLNEKVTNLQQVSPQVI